MTAFSAFPQSTLEFLRGLSKRNEKQWFEAHRSDYEEAYVGAGRAFVEHMGPRLQVLSPDVQFMPKINGSILRINRDVRFSNDKTPYKTHLDLWFWHGEKKGWTSPGFYLRITPEIAYLGTGMHVFDKPWMVAFRDAVVDDRRGASLQRTVTAVEASGPYNVGGKSRKRVPQGYPADHPRAGYLLHEGLFAGLELPSEAVVDSDFADRCFQHFSAVWPLSNWLLHEVTPQVERHNKGRSTQ